MEDLDKDFESFGRLVLSKTIRDPDIKRAETKAYMKEAFIRKYNEYN